MKAASPTSSIPPVPRSRTALPRPAVPALLFALLLNLLFAAPVALRAVEYEKDIMPIFMAKCADCHSSEAESVKAGLKFDDPAHFHSRFERNSVVVPGDWDASYLFVTLFRPADDESAMPPEGKGERLTREEVTLVMRWIAEGAPINRARGPRGEMPEDLEALLRDLPESTQAGILSGMAGGAGAPEPAAGRGEGAMEEWTNLQGRSLRAELLGVELGEGEGSKGHALLRTEDGATHRYPLSQLSEESRARALERGSAAPR